MTRKPILETKSETKPLMTRKKLAQLKPIPQEQLEGAPRRWRDLQQSIADASGIALLLVEGYQPPALAVSNNNSICQALQSSPELVRLCDPYCGRAHQRATSEGAVVHYRCHAGLQCFSLPVELSGQQLAVIGGRAFSTSNDYREFVERVRDGDLRDMPSDELFRNVIFADEADIDHVALKVSRAAEALARLQASVVLMIFSAAMPAAAEIGLAL